MRSDKNGTLVYVPGGERPARNFVCIDRKEREEPLPTEPALYNRPKLSPDARRIAEELESDLEI